MATLVLLIGAPRSGTTWLQQILASHPAVVSPPETELFSRYLAPAVRAWDRSLDRDEASGSPRRLKGLSTVLTAEEFESWTRALVEQTVGRCLAAKPGATVVVEKTPGHSLCGDVIERCAPGSRYIHLVRDGRDVAASLVAAGGSWGYRWAPTSIGDAATMWAEHVAGAREALATVGHRGCEVRYEELRAGGARALVELFAHCGVTVDLDDATERLAGHAIENAGPARAELTIGGEHEGGELDEPGGFVGAGAIGQWRTKWGRTERATFAARAGGRLIECGYESDDRWVGTVSPVVRARSVAARAVGHGARALGRWSDRTRGQVP